VVAPVVIMDHQAVPNEEEALATANRRRGVAIAVVPGVVVGVLVAVIGLVTMGPLGIAIGVVVAAVVAAVVWVRATPALVRALGAEVADEDDQARVFNQMEGLCASMGLALPAVYVVHDEARDALVLGRRRAEAVLVVTSGLVAALDPVQLEGVLAHELMHVKCGDIVPATMAAAVVLPVASLWPGAANLVHALAGRGREFRTDQRAVGVTRYPPGLREAMALMVEGPTPTSWGGRGVGRVTQWLWTVSLADGAGERRAGDGAAGALDHADVRIAALDEW
jgi:Zn-dependent protease with chaperone function